MIFRINKNTDFTVVCNHAFRNSNLSYKAKGVLLQMLSLPDQWKFSAEALMELATDGRDSIRTALKELEEHNYLKRTRQTNEKGQFVGYDYDVYEYPKTESPTTDKTDDGKSDDGKHGVLLNTIKSNTNNTPVLSNDNTSPKGTRPRFSPPSVEDVEAYCFEKNYSVDAQHFVDYYASKGWVVGKTPMKDWKAAVRTWIRNDDKYNHQTCTSNAAGNYRNSKFTSPEDARAAILAGVNAGLTERYQSQAER